MARIIAGVTSSHVPAIGAAIDNKQTEEPYWKRVFSGFEKSKQWMVDAKPDVAIVVYNDHASAFSVEVVPIRTVMRGPVADQAALHGIINRLQSLGLDLIEVRRIGVSDG